MKDLLIAGFAAATLSLASTQASATSTMTFDSLPADFSSYSTYTEDGITIASGSSNHFHTTSGITGTAAEFYQSDAFPQTVTFSSGLFTLESIDFLNFFGTISAVLTSSSGSVVDINTAGTYNFGGGFNNISFFNISSLNGGSDYAFTLDNMKISEGVPGSVPEPSTWAMMLLGFGGIGLQIRRRRKMATATLAPA